MDELIKEEIKGIETEIIRLEAQAYEIERRLMFLNSQRTALLSVAQKNFPKPKLQAVEEV